MPVPVAPFVAAVQRKGQIAEINLACPTITPALGDELLLNTGFEEAGLGGDDVFKNWSEGVTGTSTVNDETTIVQAGNHACRIDVGTFYAYVIQKSLTADSWYQLSAWIRADNGTPLARMGQTLTGAWAHDATVDDVYRQYVVTLKAVGTGLLALMGRTEGANGRSLYFDTVSGKQITFSSMLTLLGTRTQRAGTYTCTPTVAAGTVAGLVLGYADVNNFVLALVNRCNGAVELWSVIGGVWTKAITGALTYGAGNELKIIVDASDNYTLYYNSLQIGALTAIAGGTLGLQVHGFNAYAGNEVGTVTTAKTI